VLLVKALGGGWDAAASPPSSLSRKLATPSPPDPTPAASLFSANLSELSTGVLPDPVGALSFSASVLSVFSVVNSFPQIFSRGVYLEASQICHPDRSGPTFSFASYLARRAV